MALKNRKSNAKSDGIPAQNSHYLSRIKVERNSLLHYKTEKTITTSQKLHHNLFISLKINQPTTDLMINAFLLVLHLRYVVPFRRLEQGRANDGVEGNSAQNEDCPTETVLLQQEADCLRHEHHAESGACQGETDCLATTFYEIVV